MFSQLRCCSINISYLSVKGSSTEVFPFAPKGTILHSHTIRVESHQPFDHWGQGRADHSYPPSSSLQITIKPSHRKDVLPRICHYKKKWHRTNIDICVPPQHKLSQNNKDKSNTHLLCFTFKVPVQPSKTYVTHQSTPITIVIIL
jgi:hypothetical protein